MLKLSRFINKHLQKLGYKFSKIEYTNPIEEITQEEDQLMDKCLKYSMTNKIRMWALINSIKYVSNNKIDGEFVECGLWKGGNIILYQTLNKKYQMNKEIFGYDTFSGMTLPGVNDYKFDGRSAIDIYNKKKTLNEDWAKSTLDEVKKNILKECLDIKNIKFVEGKVENTLKIENNLPKKISILRLDTDFYDSTKIELEVLYPRLAKNGVLILDDYGHFTGVRKAVDEYFSKKSFLIYIDHASRMIIKNF